MSKGEMQEQVVVKKKSKKVLFAGVFGVLLLVALGVVITPHIISANKERKVNEQLESAQHYLDDLDYEQAIVAYEAVIEIDPMSVEAYFGLADAYVKQGMYEEAIEVLENGYIKTGSQLLFDEIEQLKLIIAKENELQFVSSDEIVSEYGIYEIGVPAKVVDGIYHNPYFNCILSDEYAEYLSTIVDLLDAEKYEQALGMVTVEKVDEILNSLGVAQSDNGKYINIVFLDKKIHMQTNPWDSSTGDVYMVVLPMESGRGYMLDVHNADGTSNKSQGYVYGECQNGVFWGAFHRVGYVEGTEYYYYIDGTAINGLLDGSYCEYDDESYHHIWGYNMGSTAIYDVEVCNCGCGGCTYYVDDFGLLESLGDAEPIQYHSENRNAEELKDFYGSQRVAVGYYGLNEEDFEEIDGGYRYYLW